MSRLNKLAEEGLLIFLIALNVFELIGLLPGMAGFFKAILSFLAVAFVFYKASLSEIFFGEKDKSIDLALILSYFLLITNKFVQYFLVYLHEDHLLQDFFALVIDNSLMIEKISFLVGSMTLLMITYQVYKNQSIKEPSVLSILHGEDFRSAKKFFSILIVVTGFFIILFNPLMEWFTLLLDTPFVVVVLFIYIFKLHQIGKGMDEEEFLFKISEASEEFLESFINLFHDRKTIFFGISALLVLHLVTDAYAYIIPYSFATTNIYSELQGSHSPFMQIFAAEKGGLAYSTQILLTFGYVSNVISMLILLLIPAVMWYIMHRAMRRVDDEEEKMPGIILALFYFFIAIFILMPAFKITSFSDDSELKNLIGVDIQTRSILSENLTTKFTIALIVFIIVFLASSVEKLKKILAYLASMIGLAFFGIYLYVYFTSIVTFYLDFIYGLWNYDFINLYIMCFYILFLILLALFYIGGYLGFAFEVFSDKDS